MASLLNRLLGKSEAKAVTGPGAYAMTYYPNLVSMSRQPNKLMAEAQALFRANLWIGAAERALGGRFVRMAWHLETADGETVDDTAGPAERAVQRLFERPNPDTFRSDLWAITFRHIGLAGNSAWFLDQRDERGAPLQVLYINPARLTPVLNDAGFVSGWVLDSRDNPLSAPGQGNGVPLSKEEVVHFRLDPPDWGVWGIGIAEAAQRKIELDRITESHAAGLYGSGGRLSGIVMPKTGESMNDDEWKQFANDWRRIVDDPQAAKRLQISKRPLELVQTTASPKDLQLTDVAKANRDDILAAWGVPLTSRGIATPAGLNADRSDGDERVVWESVKERAEPIREAIQYSILDRFELGLQLVFDYPSFDEATGQFENAALARTIPMTVDQRREQVGLDPLDPAIYGDLGNAIFIDQSMVRVDALAPVLPAPTPPPDGAATPDEEQSVKAKLNMRGIREKADAAYTPRLTDAVRVALADQRADIGRAVRKNAEHLAKKASDTDVWWNERRETERLSRAILPVVEDEARTVASRVRATLIVPAMKADPLSSVVDFVRSRAAERINGINQTTRESITQLIETGIQDGLSPAELGSLIEDATPFGAARAEMIARSETMLAYNETALRTYGQYEVAQVQAIDGDTDAECAARDGNVYALDDAYNITDHPNGTLDWVPVVKARLDPVVTTVSAPAVTVSMPELPAPVVNYTPPDIHIPAPQVTVQTDSFVAAIADLKAMLAAPRKRRVVRDAEGRIIGLEE